MRPKKMTKIFVSTNKFSHFFAEHAIYVPNNPLYFSYPVYILKKPFSVSLIQITMSMGYFVDVGILI